LTGLYASTNLYATLDTGFCGLLMLLACAGAFPDLGKTKARLKMESHSVKILLTWALLGYVSTHLFIEIQPRYRYFAMPAICLLAALGFSKIWRRIWRRDA
jgi:hypothetical protein